MQRDAVFFVPVDAVQHDVVDGLLACEHRREQDAVVVGVGLRAEDGDVVEVRRERHQLLERARAGHAIADHDELHRSHRPGVIRSYAAWRIWRR